MQVKQSVLDTKVFLKDYLYDGEKVEYYTQSDRDIAVRRLFLRKNLLIFLCNIFIVFCLYAAFSLRDIIFPLLVCMVFFVCIVRMLNKKIFKQVANFLPDYYFITNYRVIACIADNNGLANYKFSNIRINPKLKITLSGKFSVEFSHYFDIITFDDIPDAKEVCQFMKGKIKK